MHTLELGKLKRSSEAERELFYWLKFLKAETEEEMETLVERAPEIEKTVTILKTLSEDDRLRIEALERDVNNMAYWSSMSGAKQLGFKLGEAEGRELGREEGREEVQHELAKE